MLNRKGIHVHLMEDSHAAFRKLCIDHRLTMQEVCEYFVLGLLDEREEMVNILQEISKSKKKKTIKRVSVVENDALYNAINGEE